MKAALDKLFHSPWFILFLAAIPFVIGLTVMDLLRGRTRIEEVRVEVAPTQANGDAWDPKGGLPDVMIDVRRKRDQVAECPVTHDALAATCALRADVPRSGTLVIEVTDSDLRDDPIGRVELDVPTESGTRVFENVQQLRRLELVVTAEALALAQYHTRLTAIGIGALMALLVWWLGLRGSSLGERPLMWGRWRAISWIATIVVLFAIGAGLSVELSDDPAASPLRPLPCGLGAMMAGLVWLHGHARERYTTTDGVLIFLGLGAVAMPIMIQAAIIVGIIALVYLLLLGLAESSWV